MSDVERFRLLLPDPSGFVHLAGLAAFGAFLVVFVAAFAVSFVVSLVLCGMCRFGDEYELDVPAVERREGDR